MEKSGLCDHEIDLLENKDKFTKDHGQLIARHNGFLVSTSFKALKGPERDNLAKMQKMVTTGSQVIAKEFINNGLFVYLADLTECMKKQTLCPAELLGDSSCLIQLPANMLPCIEPFKAFAAFIKELSIAAVGACHGSAMAAEQAQGWLRKWHTQSGNLAKTVKNFEASLGATGQPEESVIGARLRLG